MILMIFFFTRFFNSREAKEESASYVQWRNFLPSPFFGFFLSCALQFGLVISATLPKNKNKDNKQGLMKGGEEAFFFSSSF